MNTNTVDPVPLRASPGSAPVGARVLVVDDDPTLRAAAARILVAAGYEVTTAASGREAILLLSASFETIVSDIFMPDGDGIDLLRAIRQRDPDVPVVLMTGAPDLPTVVQALEHGALLYLTKPVGAAALQDAVARAVSLHKIARTKREALVVVNEGGLGVGDRVGLEASFDRALDTLWMAYQPIVRTSDRSLFGYEALLRSTEKSLPHPGAILDAAERLGRLPDLGRKVRAVAMVPIAAAPDRGTLFVNLHACDLGDDDLFSPTSPLAAIADRVVLEITERASLDLVTDARGKIAVLRKMGFRIAIDDLGAGYAGLTSFATLEPEFVKLDMSLVRDADQNPTKQKLIRSMTSLCQDMGIVVVAEGIETPSERDAVVALGCDLVQGYLHAKPGPAFPPFVW